MKKLGVVITDGVGFRNFVLSDFMIEAQKAFDEVVILSCLPKETYDDFNLNIRIIELDVFEEKFQNWFFRKAKEIAHLRRFRGDNFGMQSNYDVNKTTSRSPRGYATRLIFTLTNLLHSEKWIQRFNRLQQQSFKKNPVTKAYKKLLSEEQFGLLFFTHQRPPYIAPLAYAAEKLEIRTASFIFSWDNLASKGRMAADFNYFMVWSDLMKKELLHFYASIKQTNVEVVGTPQFEPYVLERYKSDKSDFRRKFGLTKSKTICFSCGDISTSKNDELYISIIAQAIINGDIQDADLIVRTSPAEDPVRFESLVAQFPFVKWNYPKWMLTREGHQEGWSQRVPTVEDVIDLRALLENSDLNINMLSTMSLDFMQFDKPVINPVFGNAANGLFNDGMFLEFAHLVNVVNSNATKIVKNERELIDAINSYLDSPGLDSEYRKQLLSMQVSRPLIGTGKRIAAILSQIHG